MRAYVEARSDTEELYQGFRWVEHLIALDSLQMGAPLEDINYGHLVVPDAAWQAAKQESGLPVWTLKLIVPKLLKRVKFPRWSDATRELTERNTTAFNIDHLDKSEEGVIYHSIIGYAGEKDGEDGCTRLDPARADLVWYLPGFLEEPFLKAAYQLNRFMGKTKGASDPMLTCPGQRIGNVRDGNGVVHTEQSCSLVFLNHDEASKSTASVEAVAKALGLKRRSEYAYLVDLCDGRTELDDSSCSKSASTDRVRLSAETDPVHSLNFTGVLTYGQAISLTVPVDGSHLEACVGWDGDDGLFLELTDPLANPITPTVATGDPNIGYDELRDVPGFGYAGYVITDTVVGGWTLHVVAPASGSGPAINWEVIVSQRSPLSCTLTVGQEEYVEGATVHLETRPVTGTQVILGSYIVVEDEALNGTPVGVPLLDDGAHGDGAAADGVYAGQFVATQPGIHRLTMTMTGTLPSGISYLRQVRNAYTVLPASAHFTGDYEDVAVDDDADGLYDRLVITSTVHLDRAGDYEVVGWLSTPSGEDLASDVVGFSGEAGETLPASLSYDADLLIEREGDGPFVLSQLMLIDESLDLQTDLVSDAYTTTAYSNLDFSGWEARVAGSPSDQGIDTDGQGGYDLLRVRLPIEVRRGGSYSVTMDLKTSPGSYIGTSPADLLAPGAGIYTVTLEYEGSLIAVAGDDDEYALKSLFVQGPLGTALNQDTAGQTSYYLHTDFQSDTTPPSSHMLPVSSLVGAGEGLEVSWEGSDPDPGSGLVGYWLQYRVGSAGEWTDWISNTTLTGYVFGPTEPVALQAGETCYLRVQAHDLAGNEEPYTPGDGDAQFTVLPVPPSDGQAVWYPGDSVRLDWTPVAYTGGGGYYQIWYDYDGDAPETLAGHTADKTVSAYVIKNLPSDAPPFYWWMRTFVPANGEQQNDLASEWSERIDLDHGTPGTFAADRRWSKQFKYYTSQDERPRLVGDVDGDGDADIVGFKPGKGVYVARSTGSSFTGQTRWTTRFKTWTSQDALPRAVGDVDADGRADIAGFQPSKGVFVCLSNGADGFGARKLWSKQFRGWNSQNQYPRMLADVDGDGDADAVGLHPGKGVFVALSNGASGFASRTLWSKQFRGWNTQEQFPRMLGDIDGDGDADIVGFHPSKGVYVALSNGVDGFALRQRWSTEFTDCTSQDAKPRMLADVNGDGYADIVAFKPDGVYVALSTGTSFAKSVRWSEDYGDYASQDTRPRALGDANGDGKADIVGFDPTKGVYVALSSTQP